MLGVCNGIAYNLSGATPQIAPNAVIEVRREDTGALASIFSDEAGATPITNPSDFTGANGIFTFYAAGLARGYSVKVTDGAANYTLHNVPVGNAAQLDLQQIPGVVASGRNIRANTQGLAAVDMAADELVVKDTLGNTVKLTGVSVSPSLAASGANGLDTGAEAANTWYYGWVIYNPTTQTVAGLLSLSSTAPTMPSGYTYKALVTAARNNGSSNLIGYKQAGNEAYYEGAQNAVNNGGATSETPISLVALVPAIAHALQLHVRYIAGNTDGSGVFSDIVLVRWASGINFAELVWVLTGAAATTTVNVPGSTFWMVHHQATFYYLHSLTTGSSPLVTIDVLGFKLPLGGE